LPDAERGRLTNNEQGDASGTHCQYSISHACGDIAMVGCQAALMKMRAFIAKGAPVFQRR
jgi:hypothetical protein